MSSAIPLSALRSASQIPGCIPKLKEIQNFEFIYYLECLLPFNEELAKSLLGSPDAIIQTDNLHYSPENREKVFVFRNAAEKQEFILPDAEPDVQEPYHIFRNLNRFRDALVLENYDSIAGSFLEMIGYKGDKDPGAGIIYLNDFINNSLCPLLFLRTYIAEITLIIHKFFTDKFPAITYQLKLIEGDHIPHLLCGNKSRFILAGFLEQVFTDEEFRDSLIDLVELEYGRLSAVV
jgi:hypothetical protein